MIIRPGWDAPHVRCFPRVFCAWPCLLRQVGTTLGSPCDCIVAGITYANPGSCNLLSVTLNLTRRFTKRQVPQGGVYGGLVILAHPRLMVRECTLIFDSSEE